PTALIFAWTRGLRRRGEIDGLNELIDFSEKLEKSVIKTIEVDNIVTQDIAKLSEPPVDKYYTSDEFIRAIRKNLENSITR
ncbi:MAG: hypothetical protein QXO44_02475, partial [Thermoplasmatales archaeon]